MGAKITILGTGGWGTALSIIASRNENEVSLWGRRPDFVERIRESRENKRYLPDINIPDSVSITANLERAVNNTDVIIVAVPTQHIRSLLTEKKEFLPEENQYVSAAKGMEIETFKRPTEIFKDVLGENITVGVLSGPSHAEEVGKFLPCSLVSAAESDSLSRQTRDLFSTRSTRIYTNPDLVGVELAGALKNIIAIASGICVGKELGMNAQAALLSRGLIEIGRIGSHLGGRRATFFGLAGMGDLITTCMSPHGRNRSVGVKLGQGETLEQIQNRMNKVAEGIWTTKSIYDRLKDSDILIPVTEQVYKVLFEEKSVDRAVEDLMMREPRSEAEDLIYANEHE